jgi:hypothetical protein
MKTLRQFATGQIAIPSGTAWYPANLGEFRGKQELYTRQSPQRLKALRVWGEAAPADTPSCQDIYNEAIIVNS